MRVAVRAALMCGRESRGRVGCASLVTGPSRPLRTRVDRYGPESTVTGPSRPLRARVDR